jgi:hypothetical protein
MVWVLLAGGVAVYWLLVLLEALGVWNARSGALQPSWWWALILFLGGIPAGGGNRHEALGVPLSFTLPGYRESLRRSSFVRAIRWGVVFALFWFSFTWGHLQLFHDWPADLPKPSYAIANIREISLNMVGTFLGGMAIGLFWINSALVWFHRRWLTLLFGGIVVAICRGASSATIFHHVIVWAAVIPLSVFLCGFFWWRLGDMAWVKSGHRGTLGHKTGGSWGIEVRTTVVSCRIGGLRGMEAGTAVSSWWKDLFLAGMQKGNATVGARHAWAWFYRVFGPTLSQWKWIVVSLLAGVLVLGYLNRLFVGMLFVSLGLLIAGDIWLVSSTMLLPEGRREKYYLTIASGGLATLLLMAASAGVVALSWLCAALLPSIPWGTHPLQYTGLGLRNVWLACLPVPWFPIVMLVLTMIVLSFRLVLPFLILLIALFLMGREFPDLHVGPNLLPTLLPILLASGWAFLLLTVWLKYRRCDLADG